MTDVKHPAPFNEAVLEEMEKWLEPGWRVLDPQAGIGRIHQLSKCETVGVELEPEWAQQHPRTIVGNSHCLPFANEVFDAVAVSVTYANRMADHQNAQERCKNCAGTGWVEVALRVGTDGTEDCPKCEGTGKRKYKRITYRHYLGRPLHPDNSGQLQWGEKYRQSEIKTMGEIWRVLKPGFRLLLNLKNHIRGGEEIDVISWHHTFLRRHGFLTEDIREIKTSGMLFGQNREKRIDHEVLIVMRKKGVRRVERRGN